MTQQRQRWNRPILSFLGVLVAYSAFPLNLSGTRGDFLGIALTLVGLGVIGWAMVSELGHLRRGEASRSPQAMAMLLVLLVMCFSLSFFLLELARPGQIVELETRVDALYFTLATMATVGYGDVHAEGQAARALVCAVIVFDVVVVASLIRGYTMRNVDR